MAYFFLVNRDFHSSREAWFCKINLISETRNKCLLCRELWFSLCLCYFWQPLLCNKWYCVTVTSWLIPVTTTWLGWFSVTNWPAIIFILCFVYFDHNGGSASSPSTRCPRWPKCDCVNKFFLTEGNQKILIYKEKFCFPFFATAHSDFEIFKKAVLDFCGMQCLAEPSVLELWKVFVFVPRNNGKMKWLFFQNATVFFKVYWS